MTSRVAESRLWTRKAGEKCYLLHSTCQLCLVLLACTWITFAFFFLKIKNSLSNSGINHLPFLQGSLPHFMHVIDGYKELYAKGRALERKSVLVFLGKACGSAEG